MIAGGSEDSDVALIGAGAGQGRGFLSWSDACLPSGSSRRWHCCGRRRFKDRAHLGRFIAGAYLTSLEAMQRRGYPEFETLTSEVDYREIIAAVEPILARGPCYRAV